LKNTKNRVAKKFMSMAEKDGLIKSVVKAIPICTISFCKQPVGSHEDYIQIVRNFGGGGKMRRK
jgi:hypothetical protein